MSATFWIPTMGEKFSPSFNVNNGNCIALLREANLHAECCGTIAAVYLPIVREKVAQAIESTKNNYLHMRLVQFHEILKVAEYIEADVSWG